MPNEWIAPTATAVTGVAGVAFAWLTSRSTGKTQLELVRAGHGNELSRELRHERRETYAALLTVIDALDRLLQTDGVQLRDALDGAGVDRPVAPLPTGATSPDRGDDGNADDGDRKAALFDVWIAYAAASVEAMDDDTRERWSAARERLLQGLRSFDKVFQEVLLCGGQEVVPAAYALRQDMIDAVHEAISCGAARFVRSSVRETLLAAMREDLGYDD